MGSYVIPSSTIEHQVCAILLPRTESAFHSVELFKLNAGAGLIKHKVHKFIMQKYGHCEILHRKMQNISGRDITFYTAIHYTLNPRLPAPDKEEWVEAIQTQLKALDCTPKKYPVLSIKYHNFSNWYKTVARLGYYISNT